MTVNDPTSIATVEEAVEFLVQKLDSESRLNLLQMPEDHLITLHHGYGTYVRNTLGLWEGNDALKKSCGSSHPDGASGVIIHALWRRLQNDFADPAGVEQLKGEVSRIRARRPWWYDKIFHSGETPHLEAAITFWTEERAGRRTPIADGYMCFHAFEADDRRHRGRHLYKGITEVDRGDTVTVGVRLLHPEELRGALHVNHSFSMIELTVRGEERIVGEGTITQIVNTDLAE